MNAIDFTSSDLQDRDPFELPFFVKKHDDKISIIPTGNFSLINRQFIPEKQCQHSIKAVQRKTLGIKEYEAKVEVQISWGKEDTKVEVKGSGSAADNHGNRAEVSYQKDSEGNNKVSVSASKESQSNDRPNSSEKK